MEQMLRIKDVVARTRLSRAQIYAMIEQGYFPAPLKLSLRAVAWTEGSLDKWQESLKERK